ncbi:IS5-like element ISCgl6 family transposase [soil metagenome]
MQVLVFGCAYWRIADATCSATTLRRRRDAWIAAGVIGQLSTLVLAAYDRMIGLELADLAVDGCITKAPCEGEVAGRSPVDRGKQGIKRSTVVEAQGIPLGAIAAPVNRHDSPLLESNLDTLTALEPLPGAMTIYLDRGNDSGVTLEHLAARGLVAAISPKGKPAPLAANQRWVVERTYAWTNAHKKPVWCTERRARMVAFWLAFSAVVLIVGRLLGQGWTRYRWEGRPPRKPCLWFRPSFLP